MIDEVVELVDADGRPIGRAAKLAAHRDGGTLHRAVSVLLLDADGRLIVQRRARAKYHSGGRWSNTCCGHPRPGEAPAACARRRLADELAIVLPDDALVDAGVVVYASPDPGSGLAEREYDHLFVGRTEAVPAPAPSEVEATDAVDLEDPRPARLAGDGFTGWYATVVEAAMPALLRLRAVGGVRAATGVVDSPAPSV